MNNIEDWELEAYADGAADARLDALIAQSPELAARIEMIKRGNSVLRISLHRADCPSEDDLRLYQSGFLPLPKLPFPINLLLFFMQDLTTFSFSERENIRHAVWIKVPHACRRDASTSGLFVFPKHKMSESALLSSNQGMLQRCQEAYRDLLFPSLQPQMALLLKGRLYLGVHLLFEERNRGLSRRCR